MKKWFVLFILVILLSSFCLVVAKQGDKESKIISPGQQIKEKIVVNDEGEEAEIEVNERIKLRVRDVEAETDLEIEEEKEQNRTRLKVKLSNGRNAEIKVMPDVASERALERLRLKVCSEENNCTIELKEVPVRNENHLAYEVQVERHMRILALFRTKAQVKAQISAENGEVIQVKKPWWAFLAREEE